MRVAATRGLRVVARGAGTKLDWGNPPESVELVIDLSQMDEVIEHVSDDLVARVKAGTTLGHLSRRNSPRRANVFLSMRWCPARPSEGSSPLAFPGRAATCTAPFATWCSAPTVVRADGVVAHAGSKVVKNVAGYDLAKLFTGSYGTLGSSPS